MLLLQQIAQPTFSFEKETHSLVEHHISVYKNITDRGVFTAYHYTAKVEKNGQSLMIRVYYNLHGKITSCTQTKHSKSKGMDPATEKAIKLFSQQNASNYLQKLISAHEIKFSEVSKDVLEKEDELQTKKKIMEKIKEGIPLTEKEKKEYADAVNCLIGSLKHKMQYEFCPERTLSRIKILNKVAIEVLSINHLPKEKVVTPLPREKEPGLESSEETKSTCTKKVVQKKTHNKKKDKLLKKLKEFEGKTEVEDLVEQKKLCTELLSLKNSGIEGLTIANKEINVQKEAYRALGILILGENQTDTILSKVEALCSIIDFTMIKKSLWHLVVTRGKDKILSILLKKYPQTNFDVLLFPQKVNLRSKEKPFYCYLHVPITSICITDGNLNTLKVLLEYETNPNAHTSQHFGEVNVGLISLLAKAVIENRLEMAKALIEAGADVNYQQLSSAFLNLVSENDCKKITQRKTKPKSTYQKLGMKVAKKHLPDLSVPLLELSDSFNKSAQKKYQKLTALHWAAFYRHEKLIRALLERGAKPNIYSARGYSPFGAYLLEETNENHKESAQLDTINFFKKYGGDINLLQGGAANIASWENFLKGPLQFEQFIKKFPFKRGTPVKKKFMTAKEAYLKSFEKTSLMLACQNGHLGLVKTLLKAKADVLVLCKANPTSDVEISVLDMAIRKKEIDIARCLLSEVKNIFPYGCLKRAYVTLLRGFQEQTQEILKRYKKIEFYAEANMKDFGIKGLIYQPQNVEKYPNVYFFEVILKELNNSILLKCTPISLEEYEKLCKEEVGNAVLPIGNKHYLIDKKLMLLNELLSYAQKHHKVTSFSHLSK